MRRWAALVAVGATGLVVGCQRAPQTATELDDTIRSPGGSFVAAYVDDPTASDRVAVVAPVIRDAADTEVYRDDDQYSMWEGITLAWGAEGELWVLTPAAASVVRRDGAAWVEEEGATPPEQVAEHRPEPPEG